MLGLMRGYLRSSNFEFVAVCEKCQILFIVFSMKMYDFSFMGSLAILSGPAGGVVGYAETTFDKSAKVPVIGFDMGGKSV